MSDQKPSLCRNVLYQARGSADGVFPSVARAAIITHVYPDPSTAAPGTAFSPASPTVDLVVFNPSGIFFNTAVAYDPNGAPGTWRWPPRV